ncbi:hypothetical protein FQN57_003822 [Myotisia sp. PD_48]|nr:hypothetical protein FQN57_003822 [Myotisia sp. PD_48]
MDHEIAGSQEWIEGSNEKSAATQANDRSTTGDGNIVAAATRPDTIQAGAPSQEPSQEITAGNLPSWPLPIRPARAVASNLQKSQAAINSTHGSPQANSQAILAYRAGDLYSSTFKIPLVWGHFRERATVYANKLETGITVNELLFDKINRESGAFILRPERYNQQMLYIWGGPMQVHTATRSLSALVRLLTVPEQKKKDQFAKITSYSEATEARIDMAEKDSTLIDQLRRAPDPLLQLPETLIFLWPVDELPLELALGRNLEALDPLRRETGCYIHLCDGHPAYIQVEGHDHASILLVVRRLRAKCVELLAMTQKLYLVQQPSPQVIKNEVQIVRVPQSSGGYDFATPLLYGTALSAMKLDITGDQDSVISARNEDRLRGTVELSLQGLRFLRGYVRMRVHFGTFVLDQYRVPKEDRLRYSFQEFRDMLLHDRTRGHLVPGLEFNCGDTNLVAKCATAVDIFDLTEGPPRDLGSPECFYVVNFEFKGGDAALLRLEVEFTKSQVSGVYEISQKRWIRPQGVEKAGDKRPHLQVAVIDFERSDWELEIKALEFQEPASIEQSLREFSHSIEFSPGELSDFCAEGRRRVQFSNLVPVARIVEKSVLRYRVKNTDYVFELARYDEYQRVENTEAHSLLAIPQPNVMAEVPVSTWGASMFDFEWDNQLGLHANFRIGHNANWSPTLKTFFPCPEGADPADLRSGFHRFLVLVKKVAALLGLEHEKDVDNQVTKGNIAGGSYDMDLTGAFSADIGEHEPTQASGHGAKIAE